MSSREDSPEHAIQAISEQYYQAALDYESSVSMMLDFIKWAGAPESPESYLYTNLCEMLGMMPARGATSVDAAALDLDDPIDKRRAEAVINSFRQRDLEPEHTVNSVVLYAVRGSGIDTESLGDYVVVGVEYYGHSRERHIAVHTYMALPADYLTSTIKSTLAARQATRRIGRNILPKKLKIDMCALGGVSLPYSTMKVFRPHMIFFSSLSSQPLERVKKGVLLVKK